MKVKLLAGICLALGVSSLSIYYQFRSAASPTGSVPIAPPIPTSDVSTNVPTAQQENPFQKRLDEQRLNPGKPTEASPSKYPPGHDPFKAFMDTQNQQMEKARTSPFEK